MPYRILFSNIGYAKGIDGSLRHHVERFGRHFYCTLPVQEQVLGQIKGVIDVEKPDLCCFVEIDQGSLHSARFNQIEALMDSEYRYHDIAGKYGQRSWLSRMPLHEGKSNAFLARHDTAFERLYFAHGTKRLVYRLAVPGDISVFFAHFSLKKKVRAMQFQEMRRLIEDTPGEAIVLADFNVMTGFSELFPLLKGSGLALLNREDEHTFTFHKFNLALDLCICSESLLEKTGLKIIPQPFSDHAALLLELQD